MGVYPWLRRLCSNRLWLSKRISFKILLAANLQFGPLVEWLAESLEPSKSLAHWCPFELVELFADQAEVETLAVHFSGRQQSPVWLKSLTQGLTEVDFEESGWQSGPLVAEFAEYSGRSSFHAVLVVEVRMLSSFLALLSLAYSKQEAVLDLDFWAVAEGVGELLSLLLGQVLGECFSLNQKVDLAH